MLQVNRGLTDCSEYFPGRTNEREDEIHGELMYDVTVFSFFSQLVIQVDINDDLIFLLS